MPRSKEAEDIRLAAQAWERQRKTLSGTFTKDSLYKFSEAMNTHTRTLISALGIVDPEVWSAMTELCVNAGTLCTSGAKLYVEGQDRTNL
jgi:cytochrome P450